MAQKIKAAAKPVRGEGQSGKKSKVKPSAKAAKPVKSTKAATVKNAPPQAVLKPAKKLKALRSKVISPVISPSLSESDGAAKSAVDTQIQQAKAALKKQSAASTPKLTPVKARARKISIEIDANEAISALAQKWSTLYKKAEQIEAKPYNMKGQFEEKTAIVHKVLGWGYILANRNDRLEVLFKDGIKYLISNYKP
jgi:small-conductance mechanosensitive channel